MWESVRNDGSVEVYYSCAETAKLIRQVLKEKFAGVKFSVRSDSYSGGASIRVKYNDANVAERDVESYAKFFEGASFDGMIDLKSYKSVDYNGKKTNWGADYVFVDNEAKWEINRYEDQEAWEKAVGKY